jgi:NADH-quinone oxidoreductase subunit M
MRLSKAMPFAAVTFVVAGLASMGMPGFSGFVAELQVLLGAWQAWPTFAVLGGAGVVIGVAYTFRAVGKAFYADLGGAGKKVSNRPHPGPLPLERENSSAAVNETASSGDDEPLEPISVPERIGAALLIVATLVIGLYPRLLLDLIKPALESPLMSKLLEGGGP